MKYSWVTVADLHLKHFHKDSKMVNQTIFGKTGLFNIRLADHIKNLYTAVRHAVDAKVDFFVIAGDVFNMVNPTETLKEFLFSALAPLVQNNIRVFIILGNHDMDGINTNLLPEKVLINDLMHNPNITVVSKYNHFKTKNGFKCVFLSWSMNSQEDMDKIFSMEYEKDCVIFGHFEIQGAKMGANEYMYTKGFNASVFDGHKAVYSGHFHTQQTFNFNGGKFSYIGSIAKEGFGEKDDNKGFMYSVWDDGKISDTFIPLMDRNFIEIEITEENVHNNIIDDPHFHQEINGDIIKLIFKGKKDWLDVVDKKEYKSRLLSQGAIKVIINVIKIRENTLRNENITLNTDKYDSLKNACKDENKEYLFELGKEILDTVITEGETEDA